MKEDSTTPPNEEQTAQPRPKRSWGARVRRVLVFLGILLAVVTFVLQLPFVQQYLAQQVVKRLETTLESPVNLERVRVRWLDELDLTNLYVEDVYGDTLLASGQIVADFNLNPFTIFRRGLEIEAISIQGARFNIRRGLGDSLSNIQQALLKLSPGEKKSGGGVPINLKELSLTDVYFSQRDSIKGSFLGVALPAGQVYVDFLDLANQSVAINTINLQAPIIKMDNWHGDTSLIQLDSILTENVSESFFHLSIGELRLEGGKYELHNYRKAPVKTTADDQLDLKHLDLYDVQVEIDSFLLDSNIYTGRVNWIAAKDVSGFKLDRLSANEALVSDRKMMLNGLSIITPTSSLGDTLVFKYRSFDDWNYFEDKVRMDARFNDADVTLKDIMAFVPKLNDNVFFDKNRNTNLQIDGRIRGGVNNLRGNNVNVRLADGTRLRGKFSSQNLAVKQEEFLILELQQLSTKVSTLRQLIPNFQPPPNFDKLGQIDFSGNFVGFFVDFVADGDIQTDLGRATIDMQMILGKRANQEASYAGTLKLLDFDLAQWTDNTDFGLVSFSSEVADGYGLTGDIAEANLTADVQSFDFKNYTYENASLTGRLNKNFFNGDFSLRDDNVDLSFTGELDFTDSIPKFDFQAEVNKLALQPLNLSKQDLRVQGKVKLNLIDTQFSKMEGEVNLEDILLEKGEEENYAIDYVRAFSFFDVTGEKVFRLTSDIARGEVRGAFDINELGGSLKLFMLRNYPGFADRLGFEPPKRTPDVNEFSFDFHLNDSKGLNLFVDPKLGRLQNVDFTGRYNGNSDSLTLNLDLPAFEYGKLRLADVYVHIDALKNEGDLDIVIDSTIINGKPRLSTFTLLSILQGDTLDFGLNISTDTPNLFDQVNLNGLFYLPDSTDYALKLRQSGLSLLQLPWRIDENNLIRFGEGEIDAQNFALTNQERKIRILNKGTKGLRFQFEHFNFNFIDQIWDYEPLNFSGDFDLLVQINDVFKMTDINANLNGDDFYINKDSFGSFRLSANTPNLKDQLTAFLRIQKDTMKLEADAVFNLADLGEKAIFRKLEVEEQKNYLGMKLLFSGFPVNIAEYWLKNGLKETSGYFNADLDVSGLTSNLDVGGFIDARDGGFTIEALKTHYTFEQGLIQASSDFFDISNTVLYDKYGNSAVMEGGITHQSLRYMGLDARMRTRRFLGLDLEEGDNDIFYGKALGAGEVVFTGDFIRPNIYVNAAVADSTRIVIPITDQGESQALDFVKFVNKHQGTQQTVRSVDTKVSGLNLEMDLRITEVADLELIFDEQAGDILRGQGRGNLRILLPRGEDFQMYGDITVSKGNYLFTLLNVINKDFRILPGGHLTWSGDPLEAQIDIQAEYKDLKSSLTSFIPEYLLNSDDATKEAARQATNVNLILDLEGELFKPDISFDLSFPNLQGTLGNLAENKLSLLRRDQNEMNKQVFGLIVLGQFIPSDLSFNGNEVIVNTVSEYFSNQLSLLFTGLVSEFVGEGKTISSLDVDVGYSQITGSDLATSRTQNDEVVEVFLRSGFLNEKFSIGVGANVTWGETAQSSAFIGENVVIELAISKNRDLKLRFYERRDQDIGGGRRIQAGTGINWRKEFSSFHAFWDSLKKN